VISPYVPGTKDFLNECQRDSGGEQGRMFIPCAVRFRIEVEIELTDPGLLFEKTMDHVASWGLDLVRDATRRLA
jgi:hypothetical protein